MPGFSTIEQRVLARLVGEHRGRLDRQTFAEIPDSWLQPTRQLTVLLRLAVLFNRSRTDAPLLDFACAGASRKFSMTLSGDQRAKNPLTWADLETEQSYLDAAGIKMKLVG
jgi:exopolyphosphatase/guanosine-5'-triphosphate,3'-diphosphate pyrophosphatase